MASKPNNIAAKSEPAFYQLEDGALSTPRVERFALFLADEVPGATAWRLTGGRDSGGSHQYRRKVEAYPPFVERLAVLNREKEELMADDLYGEAKWMAKQLWREARATGNATLAKEAMNARLKILEKEDARRPLEAGPQSGVKTQGRPGAPVVENPQTHTGIEAIKQKLLEAGAPVPGQAASVTVERRLDSFVEDTGVVTSTPTGTFDFDAQLERLIR